MGGKNRWGGGGGEGKGLPNQGNKVIHTHHKNEVIMDTSRKNCHQKHHNDFYIWHEAMILTT